MKKTYLAALAIATSFVIWLLSGQIGDGGPHQPAPSLGKLRDAMRDEAQDSSASVRVRVRVVAAQSQAEDIVVRGRTEADRSVVVRAETSGRIVALPFDKGDKVDEGDLLCQIALDARDARLEDTRQAVAQARIEFEGARSLRTRGLQSETVIAAAEARLAASRARLAEAELERERTFIRAPFAGLVEARPVETGDLLQAGGACATIVDPDPMMLVGQITEQSVGRLKPGIEGFGKLITGQSISGLVTFIASTAAPTTRTFRVEMAVPNPEAVLRSGVTAEFRIPVDHFLAHRIPSSILSLDDAGITGVRVLDSDDRVRFVHVTIVKDAANGIWVTGLPDPARIITVGQELVTPGQRVEAVADGSEVAAAPAGAPLADNPNLIRLTGKTVRDGPALATAAQAL